MAINETYSRRDFLKLGAFAAALTGCGEPSIPLPNNGPTNPFAIEFNKIDKLHSNEGKLRVWTRLVDLYEGNEERQALALKIPTLTKNGIRQEDLIKNNIELPTDIANSEDFKSVVSLMNKEKNPWQAWHLLSDQISQLSNKYLAGGVALKTEIRTEQFTDDEKKFLLNAVKVARTMIQDKPVEVTKAQVTQNRRRTELLKTLHVSEQTQ